MKQWEELIRENIFGLRGHRDCLPTYLAHMLYCVVAEEKYNLAYFFVKRIECSRATSTANLPYGMFLTRLYRYVMETYPHLDNDTYDIVKRVMRLLALRQTRRPRSDRGKAHRFVSSSSSHHQGTSSHQQDDDNDDVETYRSRNPSHVTYLNSLHPLDYQNYHIPSSSEQTNETLFKRQTTLLNQTEQMHKEMRRGFKSFGKALTEYLARGRNTRTPSPKFQVSLPSAPNAPSKIPSTKDTSSSSIEYTSKSPTLLSSPSTNGYLNSPLSPPPRVPPPPPTQAPNLIEITLLLLPITLLDVHKNSPSLSPPIIEHPIPWNLLKAHGDSCPCCVHNQTLIFRLKFVRIREDYQEYRLPIPDMMLNDAIKRLESYHMFLKHSAGQIPSKKSRGKGSQRKKTADTPVVDVDMYEESDSKPARKRTGAEEEAARQVHAAHARIMIESEPEPAKKKIGSRSTRGVVIQDPPSSLKPKPFASKLKLRGTGVSNKGTGVSPWVPDEPTVVPATSSEETGTILEVLNEEKITSKEKVILEWGSKQEIADIVKDHKRKHDDVDDPPMGPNQGKKTKRIKAKDSESCKKPSITKETLKEPIAEVAMNDSINNTGKDVVCDDDKPQDTLEPKTDKTPNPEWFKQPARPPTPDLEWNKSQVVLGQLEQPCIELEYNYQECFNALTDKLDGKIQKEIVNPLTYPNFFPCKKILGVKSVSVKKLHGYGHLEEVIVKRADRQLYKFKEGNVVDLHLNDIKEMLILAVQHKHSISTTMTLLTLLWLFVWSQEVMIKRRVKDLQLGVESYQKKLNITAP
nr:ribosomal protein L7Ae/L30e/S12e/Gadd45 [Tanacetum cinerariifolium]